MCTSFRDTPKVLNVNLGRTVENSESLKMNQKIQKWETYNVCLWGVYSWSLTYIRLEESFHIIKKLHITNLFTQVTKGT